ncbi:MAG: MFS transporter [Rhizobacter sp.]|nr:MFS transporter [Rhizobacter sp.]
MGQELYLSGHCSSRNGFLAWVHCRQPESSVNPSSTLPAPAAAASPGRLALLVMLSGPFMVVLDFFIVNVALPALQHDLRASAAMLEWVVAGYGLANAALLVVGGRLGDQHGRRRLFMIGTAAFTLASAACGFAPDATTLVAARIAQGAAGALLQPQVIAMLSALFSGERRARAFAAYGITMGLAAAGGQVIGGALIQADWAGLGWRSCFLINLPIGVLGLALTPRLLPSVPARGGERLDLASVLLHALALVATVFPLVHGREHGWPAWAFGLLAGAMPLAAVFARRQRHLTAGGRQPLVPPVLWARRRYRLGLATTLAFFCGNASLYFVFALVLQQGLHLDALAAGTVFSVLAVGFFASSMLAPRAGRAWGIHALPIGALVLAAGHAAVFMLIGHVSLPWLLPALFVQGCGLGLVMTPMSAAVLAGLPAEHAGVASGVMATTQQLGNALGVALIGIVYFGGAGPSLPQSELAFRLALAYLFVLALAVAALARRFSRLPV